MIKANINSGNLSNLSFYDFKPELVDFKTEVIKGLTQENKKLPPKLFYDGKGSELFEQIVGLEEYYIPVIEKKLLMDNIFSINNLLGDSVILIEPGSGSCEKVRRILSMHKSIKAYIPIEISGEFLLGAAEKLAREFPDINIIPICTDYLNNFTIPEEIFANNSFEDSNKVVFFPGSSIGNYDTQDVIKVLTKFTEMVDFNGGLLIGVDLKKDKSVLELAYDDPKGVTAEFNLNLLHRIKNELNANIDVDSFYHKSLYNEELGRIEMYIISKKDQSFKIDDIEISFKENEMIHTENSYKYSVDEFKKIGLSVGFKEHSYWIDNKNYFSLHYFKI